MNISQIFPSARSDAARGLAKLAGRLDELRAEGRELRAKEAADNAAKAEASKRLRSAEARDHAFGDPGPP